MDSLIKDSKKDEFINVNYFYKRKTKKHKNIKVIYKKPVRYNFRVSNHINSSKCFIKINQIFCDNSEIEKSNKETINDNILKSLNPSLIKNSNNNIPENSLKLIFPLENRPKYYSYNNYDDQKLIEEIIKNSSNNEFQSYHYEDIYFNNIIENNPIYTPKRSYVRKIYPSNEPPIEINNNISNTPHHHDLDNFQYNNFFHAQDYNPLFQSFQNPNIYLFNTSPYKEIINLPLSHSIPLKSNTTNLTLSPKYNNTKQDNNNNTEDNSKNENNNNNLNYSIENNINFSYINNPKNVFKPKRVYLRKPAISKKYLINNNDEIGPSESVNNEVVDYCNNLNFKGFDNFSPDLWKKFYPDDDNFFDYDKGDVLNSQITSDNGRYYGEVNQNGEKNGFGKLFSKNKNRIGTWRKNKFTGWGREVRSNGDIYEGKFENGELTGKGLFKNNKMFYVGDFYKFIKHGKGDLITDKYHYKGYFINNKKNRKGKIEIFDDGIYEGTFKDDEINGKGTFMWKHGAIYEGEIKNGKMYGRGKLKAGNGIIYEGNFVDYNKGYGIITYPDGSKKKGEFQIVNKIPDIN